MAICEKLKAVIADAGYKNIKDFAIAAKIPYQTMNRVISSDEAFWSTSTRNFFRICMALHLSIDFFCDESCAMENGLLLSDPKEIRLVLKYRDKIEMQPAVDKILLFEEA